MRREVKLGLAVLALILLVIGVISAGQWWQRRSASFACPVPKKYCYRGKEVQLRDGSPAIGFQVPVGTPVQAGISGLASQGAYKREDGKVRQSLQIETSDGRKLYYRFVGENLVQAQDVAIGQPIGRVENASEAIKETGANLVVYFRDQDGQIKPLTAKDFR